MPIKNLPRLTQGNLLAVKSLGKNVIYTDTQHFWGLGREVRNVAASSLSDSTQRICGCAWLCIKNHVYVLH